MTLCFQSPGKSKQRMASRLWSLLLAVLPCSAVDAVSFTADAVQIRGELVSHAKLYWKQGQVRFEYVESGVPMAQIFDAEKKRVVWLDNENRLYLVKNIPDGERTLAGAKNSGKQARSAFNPCAQFGKAQCVRLKETVMNGRKAEKWLITFSQPWQGKESGKELPGTAGKDVHAEGKLEKDGQQETRDYHIFQWIDKKYKTVLRQENPDGSMLSVNIIDDQTLNGRKVRKLDMHAVSPGGQVVHGIQWYDNELDIVVRQQFRDDYVDELRNIEVTRVESAMFEIPDGYEPYTETVQTAEETTTDRSPSVAKR